MYFRRFSGILWEKKMDPLDFLGFSVDSLRIPKILTDPLGLVGQQMYGIRPPVLHV